MKTWAAVLSVVGVMVLGCGCAPTESAADEENAQQEGVVGVAPEAVCRQVCRSDCRIGRFGRRDCRRVCRSDCR